jgi:adenosylmethionine-8-amino-7-oxononanoate aminotransferase
MALVERSMQHIWHPCSQMKDYEGFKPLVITGSSGSYFQLEDGRKVIDAISSWWCKSLGHQHPRLKRALSAQMEKFEHVILANTTNETIVTLSEKLAALMPELNKVMYASDGSCAVEIAMKMSLHAREISGEQQRKRFIALQNGYHGETVGALSVSDLGLYRAPYQSMLFDTPLITDLPYVSGTQDALWENCEAHWNRIVKQLQPLAETTTAVILEPIVQGAAGMKIYSRDFLRRLCEWTREHDIHLIADEIMTGIGRTGKMLACEHAAIEPDFICLSKGLTAGWLPLSAVLTRSSIYELFYDDYASGKSFLHSHTHTGNVLAASVAIEALNIMEEEKICERAVEVGRVMQAHMQDIAEQTGKLANVRGIGAMVAADLICDEPGRRYGFEVYQEAVKLGALLRPIGNTVYWLPPLNVEWETLAELKEITMRAIESVTGLSSRKISRPSQ